MVFLNCVLCFDGVMVPKKNKCNIILKDIETHIFKVLNIEIKSTGFFPTEIVENVNDFIIQHGLEKIRTFC